MRCPSPSLPRAWGGRPRAESGEADGASSTCSGPASPGVVADGDGPRERHEMFATLARQAPGAACRRGCTRSCCQSSRPPARSAGPSPRSTRPRLGPSDGEESGPRPVDRGRYGSEHNLILDARCRITLALSSKAADRSDVGDTQPRTPRRAGGQTLVRAPHRHRQVLEGWGCPVGQHCQQVHDPRADATAREGNWTGSPPGR